MEDIFVLEWTYEPPDFFEQSINISYSEYALDIESGSAQARIPANKFEDDGSTRKNIHASLGRRFRAVQALSHKPYKLTASSQYRLLPDGRKQYSLFVQDSVMLVESESVDIVVKNADGKIIADTRGDRLRQKRDLAERVSILGEHDALLMAILDSYSNAVHDSADELVHLYEIRDALAKHFGSELNARNTLVITKRRWSRLGQLANDEPIKQGRHRGRSIANVRDATVDELRECRDIAFELISKYLNYAESQP